MAETQYDEKTGAPIRNFPLVLTNGERSRSVENEGAYVQALYDGFKEPETKAEAKKAEAQVKQ